MRLTSIRAAMANVDVKSGVQNILSRVENAYLKRNPAIQTTKPNLVAVSKTKPVELIVDAYSVGQRHFGENYAKELLEKGSDPLINQQCSEIKWHFIGHLQSNQVNKILRVPGLYMIQTVHSIKLADLLNQKWLSVSASEPLKVLIQVNTSQEEEKNGIEPNQVINMYRHITENCKNLALEGLMTIGKFGHDYTLGPNPDFVCLLKCQDDVCKEFKLMPKDVQISMGMSDDFEQAVEMGSTIVRVGSSIFGYRTKKNEDTHSNA